jgi:hypothetical protein
MPLDETLPPARLSSHPSAEQITRYFPETFNVRVDIEGLDALPDHERLSLAGARLPEPPEVVLLDRVLQLVPVALLRGVGRIVMLQDRGTARFGGYRSRIVRLSAPEARVRRGDAGYGGSFSLFTTTALHEIGHAVWETLLSDDQRTQLADEYVETLIEDEATRPGEPSEAGVQHYFIRFLMAALLGRGERGVSAGAARRRLAALGLDLDAR